MQFAVSKIPLYDLITSLSMLIGSLSCISQTAISYKENLTPMGLNRVAMQAADSMQLPGNLKWIHPQSYINSGRSEQPGFKSITPQKDINFKPSPPENTLDLLQCYNIALKNNPGIKQADNVLKSRSVDYNTANLNLLPSVSFDLGHKFSYGKNIDPVTNNFIYKDFSGGYTSVSMEIDLFSGLTKLHTVKRSAYSLASSEQAKKNKELELLINVTLAYSRLLLGKEQLEVERNNVRSTEAQLAVINERIKVGRSTKYETYLFQSRYSAESSNIITLQNDSANAAQELKGLLNLGYQQELNIASIDTIVLSDISFRNINTVALLENVVQTHPALKQLEMEEEFARMSEKIAKGSFYPSILLGGNLMSNYNGKQPGANGQKIPLQTQLNNNLGQNINFGLTVPIFSRFQNKNQVRKEQINISTAQLAREEARNAVITNTVQLINDFNFSKQKYQSNLVAFELNKLSYSLYDEKYKLGQISSMELLNARDMLNTYTSKYVQSKLQLYFQFQLLDLLNRY